MKRISDQWHEADIDKIGISNLVQAMRNKLAVKRNEGRYGWADPGVCSIGALRRMLKCHAKKNDMVDVANFAMMIYNREHCMKENDDDR